VTSGSENRRRQRVILVRVTDQELATIRQVAAQRGVSAAGLLRSSALADAVTWAMAFDAVPGLIAAGVACPDPAAHAAGG
jgi:ribosomal protein S12 methylthiotransferase accessory factor YcaO